MKKILFILFFQLSLCVTAQEYKVFSINGIAERLEGKQWKVLVKAQPLTATDQIRTSQNGSVTILDNKLRKIYAVQSIKGGKVETLTATQRARAKSLTQEAFTEVTKSMFGKQDEQYNTRGGVTYRGGNADEQLANWLKVNVDTKFNIHNSKYIIAIHAMNPATHKAVSSVQIGEMVELMVVNESDEALYVSVLDIDAEGVWNAISDGCELIPPHSTVMLPYPVEFFEPRGTDHLLLLAYAEMFEPKRIVELREITSTNGPTVEASAAQIEINIK